jgi:opacity protein-like surface antigen
LNGIYDLQYLKMNTMYKILILFYLLVGTDAFSQVFTNKEVGKKNAKLIDSLKKNEYPYSLPIWGDKATAAGYDLPYSAGISTQYFTSVSDLVIENLMVGFNGGTMYDLDGLVRFDKAKATASSVTVRPDIWLLPFLNVYGIFGKAKASTEVGFGIWIPDSNNTSQKILSAGSTVEFNATAFGLGITPTIGVAGGFLALDMNVAWTDVPQLSKPTRTFVFGPRMGKVFKLKKPQRTIAVWAGGFRLHLNSETDGSIALDEVFPPGTIGGKIDEGMQKVENAQLQVDTWWNGLSQQQQNNPINQAKYNKANQVLDRASEILVAADDAVTNIGSSTVQYSMDKRPKNPWNFIIGTQFQLNKHLMLRAEYGFTGSRTQFMTGLQYRFGL